MWQDLEEINCEIATQFKRLELAEKKTKQLITRNKCSEIEKHLQQVKPEKLQEIKHSVQELLLEEGEMENLEECSVVME